MHATQGTACQKPLIKCPQQQPHECPDSSGEAGQAETVGEGREGGAACISAGQEVSLPPATVSSDALTMLLIPFAAACRQVTVT